MKRVLLDTHIFIWWLTDDEKLAKKQKRTIQNSSNVIIVSAVTAWEIAIKRAAGKIDFPVEIEELIVNEGFEPLPISVKHGELAGNLPPIHADPFDRMLVAQAMIEELVIMTVDRRIPKYEINCV